jgi:hypothetical protein
MSLHKFADMVAKQGRGEDSLLIHMTPDEVQRLQKFAEANGRSLTINPDTGLPEAGMLSDLFKAVAPIALGAFLGPGAFGIAGMGLSAGTAGLITGGLTTLATGSLSRGLMAGLGAYGGAGMAEGLMGAGVGTAQQSAMGSLSADQIAAEMANTELTKQGVLNQAAADATKSAMANTGQAVSSGFNAVTATPSAMGTFAKDNWKSLAAAASPIMAGMMVPTTTPMPTGTSSPMQIKQQYWDGRQLRPVGSVDASKWGNKSFSDIYRGYNGGGIVALAGGGDIPGYAGNQGSLVSDTDILNYFKTPGLSDTQIAADMQKYQVSAADIARATGTQNQQADYEKRFVNTLLTPTTDSSEFLKATSGVGLQGQALTDALNNAGVSQGAQYALTQGTINDKGFTGGIIDASTGKPVDLYNQLGYTAGALPGDQAGLEGLYGNINYVTSGLQNLINSGRMSVADAQNAALAELARTKVSIADVKAATGKDFGNLFTAKKKEDEKKVTGTGGTGAGNVNALTGGPTLSSSTVYPNGAVGTYGNNTGNPLTSTPGDIISNPDGTVSIVPNIPGRPYGGFPGSKAVTDSWVAGGGSPGFTNKAPKTIDEFNTMFNTQTGDSMAAYKYLMGQGANPIKSGVGEIAKPYDETTLGYPASTNKMYNWDPVARKMVRNPDYVAPGRDASGNVTYGMSLNQIKQSLADSPLQGQALYDWAMLNNLTADDIAVATGRKLSDIYTEFRGGAQAAAKKTASDKAAADAASSNQLDSSSTGGEAAGGLQTSYAMGGYAVGGGLGSLGSYSDGGRLLKGPGDGVSDSIPATIGAKQQPARLADGEFVIPARIVSELGNGSTDAGAKKLYAMMDRVQRARGKTTGKNKVAANSRADKHLPA